MLLSGIDRHDDISVWKTGSFGSRAPSQWTTPLTLRNRGGVGAAAGDFVSAFVGAS